MCAKPIITRYAVLMLAFGLNTVFAAPPAGLRSALAEFETGATKSTRCAADLSIGKRKEVSRFQILPYVWRQYSASRDYSDPETAWNVAVRILNEREQVFRQATQRDWDYTDIYLMWNAPGEYRRANWDRTNVSRPVLERAARFANLMEERTRLYASQTRVPQ